VDRIRFFFDRCRLFLLMAGIGIGGMPADGFCQGIRRLTEIEHPDFSPDFDSQASNSL
jgi:hypothetical protein